MVVILNDEGFAIGRESAVGATAVSIETDEFVPPGETVTVLAVDSDNRVIGEMTVRWERHWPWEDGLP